MTRVTSHVLDNTLGRPAAGVPVRLYRLAADHAAGESHVASAVTDSDGRTGQLGPASLPSGAYRLVFDTGAYFAASGQRAFYPEVAVSFLADEADGHYHVPLLLSPFAYATYRGS
jgi:5-hydroxyisourate hydrolase